MKRVMFSLSMPGISSWNGKWSGEGKRYFITKTISDKLATRLGISDQKPTSWRYNWDDGWSAQVTATVLKKGERAGKSDGFCGYGWMVSSILIHGDIRT
jgi:hypothetical protein